MAGGFRFRLEIVRRLRQQALDAQRRVVADAVCAVGHVEDRIDQLTRDVRGSMQQARDAQQVGCLSPEAMCAHQRYRGWLQRRMLEGKQELQRNETELNGERRKLAEAMKQLKVIETLREKRKLRYDTAIRKQEQAGYDEVALQMHRRRESA